MKNRQREVESSEMLPRRHPAPVSVTSAPWLPRGTSPHHPLAVTCHATAQPPWREQLPFCSSPCPLPGLAARLGTSMQLRVWPQHFKVAIAIGNHRAVWHPVMYGEDTSSLLILHNTPATAL